MLYFACISLYKTVLYVLNKTESITICTFKTNISCIIHLNITQYVVIYLIN